MTYLERRRLLQRKGGLRFLWYFVLLFQSLGIGLVAHAVYSYFSNTKSILGTITTQGATIYVVLLVLGVVMTWGMYRLERWALYLLYLNNVVNFLGRNTPNLITTLFTTFVYWKVLQVTEERTVPGTGLTPDAPAALPPSRDWLLIAMIVVFVLSLVIPSVSIKKTPSSSGVQYRQIANVNIPPANDPGKFIGKLDQFDFLTSDLPDAYRPYSYDRSGNGYLQEPKIILAGYSAAQQFYNSGIINNKEDENRAIAEIQVATFTTTRAAVVYYVAGKTNVEKQRQNNARNASRFDVLTFSSLPNDHYVVKDSTIIAGSTRWSVVLLASNAVFFANLTLPNSTSDSDAQTIVKKWFQRFDNYQPGTQADIQTENAAGEVIGGSKAREQ